MPTTTSPTEPVNPPNDTLSIHIKHCNSIYQAEITLTRSALNIKYGPNGIGKSTIAQALQLQSGGEEALRGLTPFKYRGESESPTPEVTGAEDIRSVLVFDDTYVSQFVFQRDEVLKDSFEVFINTDEYRQGIGEIEELFSALQDTFVEQETFNDAIHAFTHLRDVFGVTKTGVLAKNAKGYKAISVGGKLQNIPEPLRGYSGFLQSDNPAEWIQWQSKGTAFLELSDNCPFCSTTEVDKGTAELVSNEYETASVKNMSALRVAVAQVGHYFESGYLAQLEAILALIAEPTTEQAQFLVTLRSEVSVLLEKLTALKGLAFHTLRDKENVDEYLESLKVDLALLHSLESESTQAVIQVINEKLDDVATHIADVKTKLGKQRGRVTKIIRDNQLQINSFLESAGYRYRVRIEPGAGTYRMLIEHLDLPGHLDSAVSHLSYGERNAFALVLFMYQVRRENPDLVILDDPVSSFDKTKKFAILHELFRGKHSIRDQTTLMLTHDLEPAIDIVRISTSRLFAAAAPVAHFLTIRDGVITEKPVLKTDIKTFSEVCTANIQNATEDIIKCIYLRRKYEVHGGIGGAYDLLSSLLHLKTEPTRPTTDGVHEPLLLEEIQEASETVQGEFPDFNYHRIVSELQNIETLKEKFASTDVGYEKVQIFRMLLELDTSAPADATFRKFVNETFHIENEYVMQLDPREFDSVPEYVVSECVRQVEEMAA